MATKLKTRLAGFLCPPGSAHHRYWQQSISDHPNFKPAPELLRQMDEEQAAYDAGEKDWVRYP